MLARVRLLALLVLLLVALSVPTRSFAQFTDGSVGFPPPELERKPPSGVGAMAVGAGALGFAGLNLVTLPICHVDLYPSEAERACVISSLVLAAGGVAIGVPSLVLGLVRYKRYQAWRARKLGLSSREGFDFAARLGGASLHYVARF